jgi:hypothetical protein
MVRIDAPKGTFVVMSAAAGQGALDRLSDTDTDPNSVFTRVFVPFLRANLTLQDAIKSTQAKVVALAKSIGQEQEPAYYDEVIGSACLSTNCATDAKAAAPASSQADGEIAFWQSISNSRSKSDFETYLAEFPHGLFASLARTRLAALEPSPQISPLTNRPYLFDLLKQEPAYHAAWDTMFQGEKKVDPWLLALAKPTTVWQMRSNPVWSMGKQSRWAMCVSRTIAALTNSTFFSQQMPVLLSGCLSLTKGRAGSGTPALLSKQR